MASTDGSDGRSGSSGAATPEPTPTPTPTPEQTPESTPTPESTGVESIDAWLADALAYDGHVDRVSPATGEAPTVHVGVAPADAPADHHAFGPPAIEVPPGTTVSWRWTGEGGSHDVVAVDGAFDSGSPVADPGVHLARTFESTGEWAYYCTPHRALGMKGAVLVREPPESGNAVVDRWLRSVDGYDGRIVDRTDASTTTVVAGAPGNGGSFAFDPVALRVSAGTTVRWRWTGEGGAHDVAFEGIDLHSGGVRSEPGVHFAHAFDEPGTYRYACRPHRSLGGRGAIVVE